MEETRATIGTVGPKGAVVLLDRALVVVVF
mgnify:CR=1 FL=1